MLENDLYERLAANMKCLRKKRKLTQFDLAEKAEVSEMTIKKIETGKQWPSGRTLVQIGCALEVDLYNLFLPVPSDFTVEKKVQDALLAALKEGYLQFVKKCALEVSK